jgi:hypothetical protein
MLGGKGTVRRRGGETIEMDSGIDGVKAGVRRSEECIEKEIK